MKKSGAKKKGAVVKQIGKKNVDVQEAEVAAAGVRIYKNPEDIIIMDFGAPVHWLGLTKDNAKYVAGELNRLAGFSPVVQFRQLLEACKKATGLDVNVTLLMEWITDPMNQFKPAPEHVADKTVKDFSKDKSPMTKMLGIGKSGDDVDVSGMSANDILARLTNKGDA